MAAQINEAAVNEAYKTWVRSRAGAIVELSTAEFAPRRDYRKEAWIAALATGNGADWADGVLAHFDKTFPEGTTP